MPLPRITAQMTSCNCSKSKKKGSTKRSASKSKKKTSYKKR